MAEEDVGTKEQADEPEADGQPEGVGAGAAGARGRGVVVVKGCVGKVDAVVAGVLLFPSGMFVSAAAGAGT